jgi:hypothetical protein
VVLDKLIPSLFSVDIIFITSTKSEHSDSPWCEPITPLFSEIGSTIIGSQKTNWSIIHGGEARRKVLRKSKIGLYEKVEAVSRLKTYLFLYEELINAAAAGGRRLLWLAFSIFSQSRPI